MDRETQNAVVEFGQCAQSAYDIKGLMLFGSRARGDHHVYSDADVMVLLASLLKDFFDTLFTLSDIAYDIGLKSGIYISPLPITTGQWQAPDTFNNPSLLRAVARDGVWVNFDDPAMAAGSRR